MGLPSTPTFMQLSKTATSDTAFKLVSETVWMRNVDVYIGTNPAYMGAANQQATPLLVSDIWSDDGPTDVSLLWFKNYTAGSNTVVVLQGTALSETEAKQRGLV